MRRAFLKWIKVFTIIMMITALTTGHCMIPARAADAGQEEAAASESRKESQKETQPQADGETGREASSEPTSEQAGPQETVNQAGGSEDPGQGTSEAGDPEPAAQEGDKTGDGQETGNGQTAGDAGAPDGQGETGLPAGQEEGTAASEGALTGDGEGALEGTESLESEDGQAEETEAGTESETETETETEEPEPAPTVRITGDDNPNGKWNFTNYNIANHYWTTPLKIKDSNGNTTVAYCGAALMDGSKSEKSFKDVWRATDPNIIKCAYYSCGGGASVAQKYFATGGKGSKWRGGVLLGHFAMSIYVQRAYPERVPASKRINLNTWRDKGYKVGGPNSTATSKLKPWFVTAVKNFMKDIEERPVPEGVKVYLCQSGKSGHQIYYYIVKETEPEEPVYDPDIATHLKDQEGNSELSVQPEVILEDEVRLMDFGGYVGREIEIRGELFDAETGESTGITASRTIKVEDGDETVVISFTVDTTRLAGRRIVAAQTAYDGEKVIVEHKDLEDEEQTVSIPSIRTEASAEETGTDLLPAGREETIVKDEVFYEGLIPGQTYCLTGRLICIETGEEVPARLLDAEGHETDQVEFTPESADGSCVLRFAVDTRELDGRSLVTFERLYRAERLLVTHEDPEDEKQTVYVPWILTEAADAETGDKTLRDSREGAVEDRVHYYHLIPGETYTLCARLVDTRTGKTAVSGGREITGIRTFVPDTAEGYETVRLPLDVTGLTDGRYVVYEKLLSGGEDGPEIAVHEDPEDEAQIVFVPERPRESVKTGDTDHWGLLISFLTAGGLSLILGRKALERKGAKTR